MIEDFSQTDWERFWRQLLQLAWWTHCTHENADAEMLDSLHHLWQPLSEKAFPSLYRGSSTEGLRREDLERWVTQLAHLKDCVDLMSFHEALRKAAHHFTFAWTHRDFDEFVEAYLQKVSALSPELVGSLRDVTAEFMTWVSKHPDALPQVHWEAFEQIVQELLISRGLDVVHVAHQRGRSADLIAIGQAGVHYLVECKRYKATRKVGMDIVNAVLGAAVRNGVEHSMLIISSSFSGDVTRRSSEWSDLNLELADGEIIAQWLNAYRPKKDMGLWIGEESQEELSSWLSARNGI